MTIGAATLLVTGGSGRLGRSFVETAIRGGHRVRILSRRERPGALLSGIAWTRGDLVTGEGLEAAVRGSDVVLHAASDPRGDPAAVDVEGTRRLLEAARREAVQHLVYPSIVGIDRLPYTYYRAKIEAERTIAASGVPHTVVRITQFHSFIEQILTSLPAPPLLFVPAKVLVQSIAVEEVADVLLERVSDGPVGRAPDVGRPEGVELGCHGAVMGANTGESKVGRPPPAPRKADARTASGARHRSRPQGGRRDLGALASTGSGNPNGEES